MMRKRRGRRASGIHIYSVYS